MMSYGIVLWLTFGLHGRDSLRTRSRAFLSRYLTRKGTDTKVILARVVGSRTFGKALKLLPLVLRHRT
jgi:hypothetical protein